MRTLTIIALTLLGPWAALAPHQAAHADSHSADAAALRANTLAWVESWRTSPEAPFDLSRFEHLYLRDDSFSSFDFARPHNGFRDWDSAARYYTRFMAVPVTWRLDPGDDMTITIRDSIAWTTLSLAGRGTMRDGSVMEMPEARVTLIFEKHDGDWLIVHEHGSSALPFPTPDQTRAMLADD